MRVLVIAGAVVASAFGLNRETMARVEGDPPFGFYAFWREVPRLGKATQLTVRLGGGYADTIVGRAVVHVPPGVEHVAGDTVVVGHPNPQMEWSLTLRPVSSGEQVIVGEMRVDRESASADEGAFELRYTVGDSAAKHALSRRTRAELVRGNRRFRYGGPYLVPIDGPELLTQEQLEAGDARPTVIERHSLVDSVGVASDGDTVSLVAFIAADGSVRDVKVLGRHGQRAGVREMVLSQVRRRWRFAAAQWKGTGVADWMYLRVQLLPQ